MVKQIGCLHLLQSYEFNVSVTVGKRRINGGYASYHRFLGVKSVFSLSEGIL